MTSSRSPATSYRPRLGATRRVLSGSGPPDRRGARPDPARLLNGVIVEQRIGPGWASVVTPCRVIYVVEEPDRRGFAYGTPRGHPEAGEGSFVLERSAGGAVELVITAVSRPAWWLARLGAPVARLVQRRVTHRYLAALDT